MHFQVDSLLNTLFLPNLASFLAEHQEGIRWGELGSATVNSDTAKCAVTENGHYYVWYCLHSRSRRFRPISVWLSATLNVAESHKINTQSTC